MYALAVLLLVRRGHFLSFCYSSLRVATLTLPLPSHRHQGFPRVLIKVPSKWLGGIPFCGIGELFKVFRFDVLPLTR